MHACFPPNGAFRKNQYLSWKGPLGDGDPTAPTKPEKRLFPRKKAEKQLSLRNFTLKNKMNRKGIIS
jgi:hypothetical protein